MKRGKIAECNNCHKDKPLYTKGLCASCYRYARNKVYQARQIGKYKAKYNDMEAFYQKFWSSQPIHKCFECGEHLSSYKNWHIHHLAVKKKYPELSSNMDVCVLLCLGCHMNYHSVAISKIEECFPNCYRRFLELKEKYQIKLYN